MRRGIRFPKWWMLLVAILSILSGQGSLVGMERFAKRHRQTLNEVLGADFGSRHRTRRSDCCWPCCRVPWRTSKREIKRGCPTTIWQSGRQLYCRRSWVGRWN